MKESLQSLLNQKTKEAAQSGALRTITTENFLVEQEGISFLIRLLKGDSPSSRRHLYSKKKLLKETQSNPFLTPEKGLLVGEISPSHWGVLNKYNICPNHLLIVTKDFQPQNRILAMEDFAAARNCLLGTPSLVFFNSDSKAGASQNHRHLQWIPLPIHQELGKLPVDHLIPDNKFLNSPTIPFMHGGCRFNLEDLEAEDLFTRYQDTIHKLALENYRSKELKSYNLLLTNQWLLIIPRKREHFKTISINALGFIGSLFVKNIKELDKLKAFGLLKALTYVGFCNPKQA